MTIVQQHYTSADILTLSSLSCSIIACTLVCVHYLVKKSGLSDTADRLLFSLACSDLVGAVTWFLDINFPGILCPYSGVVNMFGYQAAQLWTCIIGAYLIITCSAKQPPAELIFYAIAFGTPVIIQAIILTLGLYSVNPAPHGCWVKYGNIQIAFVTVPQMTSGLLNIVFLGTIVYKMRISARRWGLQSRDRGLFFVMICFLLTTVSGILESIPSHGETMYTVAVCFGGLQGFINSIAMKQRAILLFMGQVKTKIRPSKPRTVRVLPDYSTNYSSSSSIPSATTWLLHSNNPSSVSSSSSSSYSMSSHPAMNDSYSNYYQRSLRPSNSDSHPTLASMDNFSFSPFPINNDPPPIIATTPSSPPSPSSSPPHIT